jgi:hypothetical protein
VRTVRAECLDWLLIVISDNQRRVLRRVPGCTTKLRFSTATLPHGVWSTPTYELPSGIIGRCRLPI